MKQNSGVLPTPRSAPRAERIQVSWEPLCHSLEAHCSWVGTQTDSDTDGGLYWRPCKCPRERVADVWGQERGCREWWEVLQRRGLCRWTVKGPGGSAGRGGQCREGDQGKGTVCADAWTGGGSRWLSWSRRMSGVVWGEEMGTQVPSPRSAVSLRTGRARCQ